MVLFFCSMSSNILLVGDSRVKDVTSNHFVTRSLPGARMSDISNYISINQSRIEKYGKHSLKHIHGNQSDVVKKCTVYTQL